MFRIPAAFHGHTRFFGQVIKDNVFKPFIYVTTCDVTGDTDVKIEDFFIHSSFLFVSYCFNNNRTI